jgi:hypothetical protein
LRKRLRLRRERLRSARTVEGLESISLGVPWPSHDPTSVPILALIHNYPQFFHRVVVSTAETPPRMMVGMSIRDVPAHGAPVVGYFPR